MRRALLLAATIAFAGLLASPAGAAEVTQRETMPTGETKEVTIVFEPAGTYGLAINELGDFGRMASTDPDVAKAITANPSVVDDDAFVARHAALKEFLERYPGAADRIKENPGNYVVPRHDQKEMAR